MTNTTVEIDVDALVLDDGNHDSPDEGCCAWEAYNLLTTGKHTDDQPDDVSALLHQAVLSLNDGLDDKARQQLKAYLPRVDRPSAMAGTDDDGRDEVRAYLAVDWLVRTYLPTWLDWAGHGAAASLRGLAAVYAPGALVAADILVDQLRDRTPRQGSTSGMRAATIATAVFDTGAWAQSAAAAWSRQYQDSTDARLASVLTSTVGGLARDVALTAPDDADPVPVRRELLDDALGVLARMVRGSAS